MVFVLPAVQQRDFSTELAQTLSKAGTDLGTGFVQGREKTKAQEYLDRRLNPPKQGQQLPDGSNQTGGLAQPNVAPIDFKEAPAILDALQKVHGKEGGKVAFEAYIDQQKEANKERRDIDKFERGLTEPGIKEFYNKISEERNSLPEKEVASEAIINAIKSGETGVFSSANIGSFLENLGAPPEIRKALETPGSKEFKSASKTFLASNIKDAFRGTTNQREINIAEEIGAELGVNENANLAAAFFQQVKVNISRERIRLVDEAIERGVSPSKVPALVDKQMQPFIKEEKQQYFEAARQLGFK